MLGYKFSDTPVTIILTSGLYYEVLLYYEVILKFNWYFSLIYKT